MRTTFALALVGLALAGPANARDLRCDTPGVAQMIIPDMFSKNPSAKKLGLEVDSVTILIADDGGGCIISVGTNHGYAIKYRFQFGPNGVATLDMVP